MLRTALVNHLNVQRPQALAFRLLSDEWPKSASALRFSLVGESSKLKKDAQLRTFWTGCLDIGRLWPSKLENSMVGAMAINFLKFTDKRLVKFSSLRFLLYRDHDLK